MTLQIRLSKRVEDGKTYREPYFNSDSFTVANTEGITKSIEIAIEKILNLIAVWLSEGSGWVIELVLYHYLNLVSYLPLRGKSYIELPKCSRNPMKGLVNLKHQDNECFRWCHVRHLNPIKRNPQRVTKADREYVKRLDYTGVTFPVSLKDMDRIERQNQINVSVFGWGKYGAYPIRVSKGRFKDHIELLWIEDENENGHYVLIYNFNRFMSSFTKYKDVKHFCMHCLKCCSSERTLKMHLVDCIAINGTQAVRMPEVYKDKNGKEIIPKVYFNNFKKMLPAPFVIYADFEALTEKIDSCQPSSDSSYTNTYQSHRSCSFAYKVVCIYSKKYSKPLVLYHGQDAVEVFIQKMFSEVEDAQRVIRKEFNKPLVMTDRDEKSFQNSTVCNICKIIFREGEDGKVDKVRDHCHITGCYRGAAHSKCNLSWQISAEKLKIPVVFHNLKGYDSHLIMQKLGKVIVKKNKEIQSENDLLKEEFDEEFKDLDFQEFLEKRKEFNKTLKREIALNVIAQNFEKYLGFNLGQHLTFIDSFSFMSQSLDRLSSNLSEDLLKYTRRAFPDPERFNLLRRKGVYPYDYMDSFSRFRETSLPRGEDFYSILNDSHISEEDYMHAQDVWRTFGIKNLGEYHNLYLQTDVLLLTDVFENFRRTCLQYYSLDPCHYYSAPGLSWDALLRMTNENLELITDLEQQLFIEKGMRGGISTITHRYAKANNRYMSDYNPQEESSYIIYLDANNLYGWAMLQTLPIKDFKWIEEPSFIDFSNYTDTSEKGLILEVDLEYPQELHDLHNDYPLAPEKIKVTDDMLSPHCKALKDAKGINSGLVQKLVPNLLDKEKYVLHYRNLKQYLSLGLKLKKIHRALEFTKKPWMKSYIDFNTEKRKLAKNSFEKDFFKLMKNSVFGKTMENLRKRSNISLLTDGESFVRLTRKPTYVSSKIFDEDLVGVQMKREVIKLDKPSYVGFSILELSKTLMYDFHYNYIRKKYPEAQLLFTDTDSLVYHIVTEDVYSDFYMDKHLFDNSDYPKSSKFYFDENKKVIGKFKDEAAGEPIVEFIGLKSKMYSYETECKENKTAKGVKKGVIRKELSFTDYKNTLLGQATMRHKMKSIRSDYHQIKSYEINKVSLSPFDDKRYILDDGITSRAYGQRDSPEIIKKPDPIFNLPIFDVVVPKDRPKVKIKKIYITL